MLAMGLGMAFLLSPKLTIVFLITTPILTILLTLIVRKSALCTAASKALSTT